ncbi:MAG TPA: hypothetical protein VLF20_02780 [Patescibacteria group bacterium]|nr:hypothetical protein [Patescibacteria group bacterium]
MRLLEAVDRGRNKVGLKPKYYGERYRLGAIVARRWDRQAKKKKGDTTDRWWKHFVIEREHAADRLQTRLGKEINPPVNNKSLGNAQMDVWGRRIGRNAQRSLSVLALGIAGASAAVALFAPDASAPVDISWTGSMFSSATNAPVDITPDVSIGGWNVPVIDKIPEIQVIPDVNVPGWAPEAALAGAGLYYGVKSHLRLRRDKQLGLHKGVVSGSARREGTLTPEEFVTAYNKEKAKRKRREYKRRLTTLSLRQAFVTKELVAWEAAHHDAQQDRQVLDRKVAEIKAKGAAKQEATGKLLEFVDGTDAGA